MSKRRSLQLEGEPTQANLNNLLSKISERLDKLEGRSGSIIHIAPVLVQTGQKGSNFRIGNISVNQYGDDSEKGAIGFGCYMDENSQWIALQTKATILEFDTTQNAKYYYNTGLTIGVPYTPTLDLTVAL